VRPWVLIERRWSSRCEESLRLLQPYTQIGDVAEIIGPVDFHDVQGPPFAFEADLNQPQNSGHALPRLKDERQNTLVAWTPQNLRQSLQAIPLAARGYGGFLRQNRLA
jgi:hypothetical protein